MNRLVALALVGAAGCAGRTWRSDAFKGTAPEPVVTTPVVDCTETGRVNELALAALDRAVTARAGESGRATGAGGRDLCREIGSYVHGLDIDRTDGTRDLVRRLAAAHHASSVVIPVLAQESYCQNEGRAIRDRNGVAIGSIDTGREICEPGYSHFRLFLFAADGTPLWFRLMVVRKPELADADELRAKATELVASAPAALEHHPDEPVAVYTPAMPGAPSGMGPLAAYPPAAPLRTTLDASAPPACKAALALCAKQPQGAADQCKSQIVLVVQYQPAEAASASCNALAASLKLFAPR